MTRMRFHHVDKSGRIVRLVTRDPVEAVEHLRQRGAVGDRVLREGAMKNDWGLTLTLGYSF